MDTHTTPMRLETAVIAGAGISESPAINELAAALAKAQGAFSNPGRDRENPFFGSRYTTLGAVIEATRGPLADNGLSLTQTIGGGHGGRAPLLRTRLLHGSGQWIASEVPLFAAGKGSQAFGSELTYMRRYAVCALLNIAPAEGDDDGNAAQSATGAGGSTAQAPRGEQLGNGAGSAPRAAGGPPARAASRAQAPRSGPASSVREEQLASSNQPSAVRPRADASPAPADRPRRRKDEPSPPSVWGILRPGKAGITAPDGAAWLRWWTTVAGKAATEGKLDELRALYKANVAAWDEIALGSAEAHDAVAEAAQLLRSALDG